MRFGYCKLCTTSNGVRVVVLCYHNAGALHLDWLVGYVAAIMPVLCTFKYIGALQMFRCSANILVFCTRIATSL
jgi:hypothetical protein